MFFSVGILHSARKLIETIDIDSIVKDDFVKIFDGYHVASTEHVLNISQKCDWIKVNTDGFLVVGDNGNIIQSCSTVEEQLRIQLKHAILAVRPPWSAMIPKGRIEAIQYFPQDIVQIFDEANLLNGYDSGIIKWWDQLAKAARGNLEDRKLEVGRIGERLSLDYERKRTGYEPQWSAVESNLLGYDILSVLSSNDNSNLKIEVKTCDSLLEDGLFYITRNEWYVAENSSDYVFHLWYLKPKPTLKILQPSQVKHHVPGDNGLGEWINVQIPITISEGETGCES